MHGWDKIERIEVAAVIGLCIFKIVIPVKGDLCKNCGFVGSLDREGGRAAFAFASFSQGKCGAALLLLLLLIRLRKMGQTGSKGRQH